MMQIAQSNALNILRSTPQSLAASGTSSSDPQLRMLQRADEALNALQQDKKSSADLAKERAARKLAELQQQVEMLKSGGLSPEATARLAAQLSQKIASAAAQFASAVAGAGVTPGAVTAASTEASTAGTAATSSSADAASAEADPATAETEPVDTAQARKAYQDTAADGEQQATGLSDEDRSTLEKLQSLLREVRQILNKAMDELRNGKTVADATQAMPMPTAASAIPSSIVI
ncbi:hypothetical protein ACQZ5H_12855 [Rhizobium sp. 21-4511-3d]